MNSGISSGPHRGSDDFSPMDEKNALYVSYFLLLEDHSSLIEIGNHSCAKDLVKSVLYERFLEKRIDLIIRIKENKSIYKLKGNIRDSN